MRLINQLLTSGVFTLLAMVSVLGEEAPIVPGGPRLMPEKTLAYVRIENADEFRQVLATSATGKMLADPKLKPVAGEIFNTASDLFQQIGDQIGLSLEELLAIPQGQFAVALLPLESSSNTALQPLNGAKSSELKDESPDAIRKRLEAKRATDANSGFGVLAVIETGTEDGSLEKILATVEQKLIDAGSVTRTENIGGTKLVRIIRPSNEKMAVEYFSRNGATVIGIGSGLGRAALDRWNGDSTEPTLAQSTDFAAVMGRCIGAEETRPQITFFVDPYRIVERIIKGSGGGAALVWPLVEDLGLGKIRGIGGSVFQGGELFDDISHMHILLDPPRDGIFGVVRPSKGDTNPPDWVPSDVASYLSLSWRMDKTFDGFERIFDKFAGDGGFATRVTEKFKQDTGLDLRESLVNATQDRAAMITWLQQPVTFNSQARLIAIQLKDPAEMTRTIGKLRETVWKRLESDVVGTTTVYRGRKREREPRPGVRSPEPCAAIVGEWVMISDSRQLLEHAIRANSGAVPRLSSLPDYDLVASEMGAQLGTDSPFMFSFSRASEALRQVYELAKSSQIKDFVRSRGEKSPVAKRIAELIEKNELPPFDEFKKYFAPSGAFAYDEPTGIHFGRYTLKAE